MNKKSLCFCLVLIVLLLGVASQSSALQIVYPADGSYVTKSNYLIIKGGRDPLLDGMAIEINGVKSDVIDITLKEYRAAFADMLVLEPLFDPGENHVVVEGYLNGEIFSVAEKTIYYLADQAQSPPEGFHKEVFHDKDRDVSCAECHVMDATRSADDSAGTSASSCASCHARMLNKKHVHGPAGVFDCLFCHDANSTPFKYAAKEGDAEVCVECHQEKILGFGKNKFVHGPVEAGMCLVCHDPHASDQPAQLLGKVNDLCLSCHSRVDVNAHVSSVGIVSSQSHPLSGPSNPARVEQEFHCASCHDPHGGNAKQLFVQGISSRMGLCSICHAK